jgi:hypothetical protein
MNRYRTVPKAVTFSLAPRTLLCLLLAIVAQNNYAQLSADLSYSYKSESTYKVTLQLYYNCDEAEVPATQSITIFEGIGRKVFPPVELKKITSESSTTALSSLCSKAASCLKRATYQADVQLMSVPGGYNLNWTSCCITTPLLNVLPTGKMGFNLVSHIPGKELESKNSMPSFNVAPVISICRAQQTTLSYDGKDADGDSLVYEFSAASQLSGAVNPQQTSGSLTRLPEPPPYPAVQFANNFSDSAPVGLQATFLDSKTGKLEITAPAAGDFLFSVSIKEFRNKKLLSTHQRVQILSVHP